MQQSIKIAIIGAGPAGTTMALEMHKKGYEIVLFEKDTFPRFHIGCNLSEGTNHWLKQLDISSIIAPSILSINTPTVIHWENNEAVWKQNKNIHIDRGIFDNLLLNYCRNLGIQVIQPVTYLNVRETIEKKWNIQYISDNQNKTMIFDFLVEATGRKSSIIKSNKKSYTPPLLASYTIVPQYIHHNTMEALRNGWLYSIPFKGTTLLTYYTSPENYKKYKSPKTQFLDVLNNSLYFSEIALNNRINTCNAGAHYDEALVHKNYIKIGDAAYTLDPISAQGVCKSMKIALQASIVTHTLLKKPVDELIALRYYKDMIQNDVLNNHMWTHQFYQKQDQFDSKFWQQYNTVDFPDNLMKLPQVPPNEPKPIDVVIINPKIKFVDTPILDQEFISTKIGLVINNNEAHVFVNGVYLYEVVQHITGETILAALKIIKERYQINNTPKLLNYLLENNILVLQQ